MNNEPVAWMALNELNGSYSTFTNDQKQRLLPHVSQCYGKWIPLYTHPVKDKPHPKCDEACMYLCQMRELTDEEIMEIVADKYEKGHGRYIDTKLFFVEFAKAILRKAQEK